MGPGTGSADVAVNASTVRKGSIPIGACQAGIDSDFLYPTPEDVSQICI
jgi:hypothetical protein